MAVTRAAQARHRRALVRRCSPGSTGSPARDLIFDPLVFPVGTGDENYVGSAVETIEGIRAIKARFPECQTILGISNVSFGLPAGGARGAQRASSSTTAPRRARLRHRQHASGSSATPSIPEEERAARRGPDLRCAAPIPVAAFAAHFREQKKAPPVAGATLPLDERLARYIVEGSPRRPDRRSRRSSCAEAAPLEIINGPLMRGMDEVGRLFNDNQLIVAEVLQSAEAMKAAVAPSRAVHGEGRESPRAAPSCSPPSRATCTTSARTWSRSSSTNNGYRIINLGIKVPPEDLIAAYHTHKPDAFGLSGLLVKSAQQMVVTAQDLHGGRHRHPALRGRRGADAQVHGDAHRRRVRRRHALRQGRDGRARPRQPALPRDHARRAARARARRAGGAARRRRAAPAARRRPPAPRPRASAVSRDVAVPRAAGPRAPRAARRAAHPRLSRT